MRSLKFVAWSVAALAASPLWGSCQWDTLPTPISFGSYSVFVTTSTPATSMFTITCTKDESGRITLSRGSAPNYTPRMMFNGGNSANYNLFLDPAGTMIWGDNSGGTVVYVANNPTKQAMTFTGTIHGIVPAAQDLVPGTYADTVFATLSWTQPPAGSLPPVAISVTMTVIAECRVDAFSLDFGTYDPFSGAAVNQSAPLKVYCTRNTSANVVLNSGSFPLGPQRRMMSAGGAFLSYNATLPLSSGTSTSSIVPVGGFTVSGIVPAAQDASVGNYADTLVATVNY